MFGDAPRSHWRVRGLHGDVWLVLVGVPGVTVERPFDGRVAARRVREWFPDRFSSAFARAQLRSITEALGGVQGPADSHARVALALRDGRLVATPAEPHVALPRPRLFEETVTQPDTFEPSTPRETEPTPSEPVEAPTFTGDIDAAAIALAQRQAAAEGKPFCEVCERNRLARQQREREARRARERTERNLRSRPLDPTGRAPEVIPPTFGEDIDAAAIAQAQRQAAVEGKPFCEVCERARLARQQREREARRARERTERSLRSRTLDPTTRAPEVVPPTFSENVDAAAIAEVQRHAATTGTPFCEVCERARRARQQREAEARSTPGGGAQSPASTPEVAPPPTFSENLDAAAMADTQRNAAAKGTPFCEVCERARRARQQREAEARSTPDGGAQGPASTPSDPSASAPEATPPPTFSENLDAAAMADTQRSAAAKGTPFCEVCERARRARQQQAPADPSPPEEEARAPESTPSDPTASPTPGPTESPATALAESTPSDPSASAPESTPSTFSENVDAAAMADTQRSAAAKGAPFCEVCERARRARERAQQPPPEPAPPSTDTPAPPSSDAPADTSAPHDAPTPQDPGADAPAAAQAATSAPTAPEPSTAGATFPPNLDAAALADVQRQAAASGVAVCEVCMRNAAAKNRAAT